MSFPNLDSRPPKALLPPKVMPFFNSDTERLPIPDKRTTSLGEKRNQKSQNDIKGANNSSQNVLSSNETSASVTVKPNEYTKTSLDRPNSQDRAKKRLILHQQQQQQIHHQQQKLAQSVPSKTEVSIQPVDQLDPSDDVFVNYYKQVNSANKTFSTFRGPLPDPKKYLREEDQPHDKATTPDSQILSERFKPINEEKSEDDDKEEQTLDYTPLSLDTNYVKVSPPKLMRRQKKSGGSESDSSGQNVNAFAGRKTTKEKAPSPNKSNKKSVNFKTDEKLSEAFDSSNDSSNSEVFNDDPATKSCFPDRVSASSKTSEDFPPPPPQLLEPTTEYISLENAEKSFITQSFEEKCSTSVIDQHSNKDSNYKSTTTNETKVVNKIGTVFPRKIPSSNSDLAKSQTINSPSISSPDATSTHPTSNNSMHSVMELKLTLRLEGNGECQRMTVQDLTEENHDEEALGSSTSRKGEFSSAIVTKICKAVTTIAKNELSKNDSVVVANRNENSRSNLLYNEGGLNDLRNTLPPKSFQNSVYGLSENSEKIASQTFSGKSAKSPVEVCRISLQNDEKDFKNTPKKQSLADYGVGKITTVADVHRPAVNHLHNYTSLDIKPKSEINCNNDSKNQRYTSIKQPFPSSNVHNESEDNKNGENDHEDDEDNDDDFESLKSSVMTHMNWDDLMQEAKSLGIPLNRPNQAIVSNNQTVSFALDEPTISPQVSMISQIKPIPQRSVSIKGITLANFSSHSHMPSSTDLVVEISSSTLSKSAFTLPKKTAPTLTSHTAALQKSNLSCNNHNCSCTSPCSIYDQPRNFNHAQGSFSAKTHCSCQDALKNYSQNVKQNNSKPERRFHSFRIKLANLFCKRLYGRNSEKHRQVDSQLAYKAVSESYKCTCPSKHNYPGSLSSSMSAKQLSSKKLSNGHFHTRKDLDMESFLSDTALTSRRNVCSAKSTLSSDTCIHNLHHSSHFHHFIKPKRHSPDEGFFDWQKNLERLQNHAWYWGSIGLEDAEDLLEKKKDGSFLVRDSSDERYILSLSFRSDGQTHHTRIEQHKGRFSFFSHWSSQHTATVDRFIMEAMELSKKGRSLYFLKSKHISSVPIPVRLLYPVLKH